MKSVEEIGMKITAAQREYYRYTGISEDVERRGMGSSRPELAWIHRLGHQGSGAGSAARGDGALARNGPQKKT